MGDMYFIGVSTGESAIRRIFPKWCRIAHLGKAALLGIDLPVGSAPAAYRDTIARIRDNEDALGALVTTHKVGVAEHAGDLFTDWSDDARELGEVSCIVRRNGRLSGIALDVECSGYSLRRIVAPVDMRGRSMLIFGAGGAGTALATYMARSHPDCPVTLTDINPDRFAKVRQARGVPVRSPEDNDAVLRQAPRGAIVVNATGLGKDLPGSPVTQAAKFPKDAIAWELNYRGDLQFLEQARRQGVRSADGWDYFVRGWSTTIARVYDFDLTDPLFEEFRESARQIYFPAT